MQVEVHNFLKVALTAIKILGTRQEMRAEMKDKEELNKAQVIYLRELNTKQEGLMRHDAVRQIRRGRSRKTSCMESAAPKEAETCRCATNDKRKLTQVRQQLRRN